MPEEEIERVLSENRQLRERIADLEERLRGTTRHLGQKVTESPQYVQIQKILEMRDKQLQVYTKELEEKNNQLSLWMSTLLLYQHIFENDPACLIGVNRDLKIVLFNRTATQVMGESFRQYLGKPLGEVDLSGFDPAVAGLAAETVKTGRTTQRRSDSAGRHVEISCYPLGSAVELKGVLVRLNSSKP
jgi:PAS domain-containing protein